MTGILLIVAASAHASDDLAKYAAFMAAHPTFKVDISSLSFGKPALKGSLLVQRPGRLLCRQMGPSINFSVSSTEKGYVEIERGNRSYDEFPPTNGIGVFQTDISPAASALVCRTVLMTNLKPVFPADVKVTPENGDDLLYRKNAGQMGTVEVWAKIGTDGRLLMVRQKSTSPQGKKDLEWDLSNYTFPTGLSLKDFLTPLPLGFEPNSLPRITFPLQKTQTAPTAGWVDPASRQKVDFEKISGGKPFLLGVLSPGSGPSVASLASLKRLKSQLPVVWTGIGGYSDPSGELIKKLAPPAYPMFYLIDGHAKVAKLWLGYDAPRSAKFEADVLSSSKDALNPPPDMPAPKAPAPKRVS